MSYQFKVASIQHLQTRSRQYNTQQFEKCNKFTTMLSFYTVVIAKIMTMHNATVWKTQQDYNNAHKTKDSCMFSYCNRTYDIKSNTQSTYLEIGTHRACFLVFRDDLLYGEGIVHYVNIQECPPNTNPKNVIHERSDKIYLTLGNILQHLFNFDPIDLFQLLEASLCLTSIEPNLTMCSTKMLQVE